ncbi:MAG: sodium:proton antiporter [Halieaceae bacterium]|nr:sodium:proton antiporter [Halieaceae bacterium]
MDQGFITLLPTILVLGLALWSRRTLESVLAGALVAFLIMEGLGFLDAMAKATLATLMSKDVAWVMLVCGLYGGFIALLVKGGGSHALGRALISRIKTKRGGLLATWSLGLLIFLDDYLNSLTVGATMKAVTDRFRTSRAMLAYVVDSTAAPLCLLVPLSSWGVYFASLLEQNDVAAEGQGIAVFIETVPYLFYPMVALLIVPLVAIGVIPLVGAMRRAEERAERTCDLGVSEEQALAVEEDARGGVSVFFLPMMAMVLFSTIPSIDLLRGVIAAILFTFAYYGLWHVMPILEVFDTCIEGIKSMVPVLAMLLTLFVFVEANDRLGLTPYVIDAVSPFMTAGLLPVVVFVTVSTLSFTTGSNWGVIAIVMPIAFPLAQTFGVSIPLVMGALFSASAFGSQACFYSDSTVLSAQGAGCTTHQHAVTQLPYALLAAAVSAVLFVIVA